MFSPCGIASSYDMLRSYETEFPHPGPNAGPAMTPLSARKAAGRSKPAVEALAEVRGALARIIPRHETETGATRAVALGLDRAAGRLAHRLTQGPDAPAIVVILGATGTGKSKLFNTLAGAVVSKSGFIRPTTNHPVLLASEHHVGFLSDPGCVPGYEIVRLGASSAVADMEREGRLLLLAASGRDDNLVLADTPDFDSVRADNRRASLDLLERADAVIFMTDTLKYADQAAWDVLDSIKDHGREALLVLNRERNPESRTDFQYRLQRAGLDRPLLGIRERPDLGDDDLLPASDPAVRGIRDHLTRWSGPDRQRLVMTEAARDWGDVRHLLNDRLLPDLRQAQGEMADLAAMLAVETESAGQTLGPRLAVAISGELKASLIQQIQSLFLKWDLMRYPRRVLGLPYRLMRDKVLAPMGMATAGGPAAGLDREIDRLFSANQETLAGVLADYNHRVRQRFAAGPVGRGLMEQPGFPDLAMTPEMVREDYRRLREDLEAWVGEQARELVKGLGLGEKMTFYLAQAVSLGLFISIQVHTGGGFSLFDGVLDGVAAPLLAKLTGQALSREKVRAFETESARRHLGGCLDTIRRQEARYREFLAGGAEGIAAVEDLSKAAARLRQAMEALS